MASERKMGRIDFVADFPMSISDTQDTCVVEVTPEQEAISEKVGSTIKAYVTAAENLLTSKYSHLRDHAPLHLQSVGNVLVACCDDGVVVRYEKKKDEQRKYLVAWMHGPLTEVAPVVSQNVVYCHSSRDYSSQIPVSGSEIKFTKVNDQTGEQTEIFSYKFGFDAVLEQPTELPRPPAKPFCLLSVQNSLEIELHGEMLDSEGKSGVGQQFVARTPLRLPVGWECIEVFPFIDLDMWRPEYASMWAETDILASVITEKFREDAFNSLDPKAAARKHYGEILRAFRDLLDSDPEREETLQAFLKEYPVLLCPTFTKVWPKLPLGPRVTDFVFCDATGDYMLVELEKSTYPLFVKSGDISAQLNHAKGQISDWRRYLEDNLSTVQRELGLGGISTNPRGLIVIGRSHSLVKDERRKLVTLENESPRTKIMTYDDVLESAKAVGQNLFGPLWEDAGSTRLYFINK